MATNNAINLSDTGVTYYNGSGVFSAPTLTQHAPIIGDASNAILSTAALTNGQLLIGSTGVAPVVAALTAGSGITITPAAGSITIASTAVAFTWQSTSVNIANMAVNNGYVCIAGGAALTLGLPLVHALGDIIEVTLAGATSFQITQGIGQTIRIGSIFTTLGVAGSLTSTKQSDSLRILCIGPSRFIVLSSMGNISVV